MPVIRPGGPEDLPEIAAIQADSPEAAHWPAAEYLHYDLLVAVREARVAGFVVSRTLDEREREILNLAVAPEFRRRGIARSLVAALLATFPGTHYLEVRASNGGAQEFYKALGFKAFSVRPAYYNFPEEPAIVMKFHSC